MFDFHQTFRCPKHYVGSEVAVQKLHAEMLAVPMARRPGKPALNWEYIYLRAVDRKLHMILTA